jgi:hypothetical protein
MKRLRNPAVGTDAAANLQDFGTSRWWLSAHATSGDFHTEEALRSAIGTSRQLLRRSDMSGVGGKPDSITDGLDQMFLG